jgi:hypothetical protein
LEAQAAVADKAAVAGVWAVDAGVVAVVWAVAAVADKAAVRQCLRVWARRFDAWEEI